MELLSSVFLCVCIPVIAYITINLLLPDTKPRDGIYATPGGRWYTFKWLLIYFALKMRHRRNRKHHDNDSGKNTNKGTTNKGYGIGSYETGEEMESVMDLGEHPDANMNNSIYIHGINKQDGTLIDVRIAKRPNNVREVWFFLKLPGIDDFLLLPRHPSTMVHDVISNMSNGFEGDGLTIEMVEPMKTWNISYQGDCRLGVRDNLDVEDERETVHVTCTLRWTAFTPYVNFETDLNPRLTAENIAKEKWSRTLFDNMKSLHQTHYEQFGEITGVIHVSGQPEVSVSAVGVRDRSIGPRNWDDFYSYCLMFAVFEDGTSLHVGAFCLPKMFSHLNTGFLIDANRNKIAMVSSTLSLPDILSEKPPPKNLFFNVKMENGMKYTVSAHVEPKSTVILFPNENNDIKIYESKCKFNLNGVRGNGICEILIR